MITTGFSLGGVHSSTFHIICDPDSRQILPEKRRNALLIPGVSGSYFQEDGSYSDRQENFKCYYLKQPGEDLYVLTRNIAAWLAAGGELIFDNEPDKYYSARFMGAAPQTNHLKYGEFDVGFLYSPPFAYTRPQTVGATITSDLQTISANVNGTAPTPCRITIKNTGNTTIQNLTITHRVL